MMIKMLQLSSGAVGLSIGIVAVQTTFSCLQSHCISCPLPFTGCNCGLNLHGATRLPILKFSWERLRKSSVQIAQRNTVKRLPCRAPSSSREPSTLKENEDVLGGPSPKLETIEDVPERWKWNKTPKELVAYGVLVAAIPIVPILPRFEWSGAVYFLFLAVWSVYVGSHRSLGKKPSRKMSFNQGLAVPLFCSASLFGFYCLLRFFPDLDLRAFISAYLGVAGAAAVASNLAEPLSFLLPNPNSTSWKFELPKWIVDDDGADMEVIVSTADVIAVFAGIGATIASKQAGAPYTLKNFIAVCIVTELLQLLSLGSFTTAAVMLSGLLLYDVFWVFGSSHIFGDNVMVTVATSSAFDGPMKLIFPQFKEGALNPYSILGLGDIAAPGLLIALMLRFDRSRVQALPSTTVNNESDSLDMSSPPDKTYFVTCLASYVFGLTVTVVANTVSGAAQPALLYLVPSLLCGVFFVAASRSETPLLLNYKDETLMSPVAIKNEDTTN